MEKNVEAIAAWDLKKVKSKKRRLFRKHKETKRKFTLLHDGHAYVTSKMRSWNPKYRSIKAEWCCGRDTVKDDSGAYAVQHFYSPPKRSKLRSTLANKDDKRLSAEDAQAKLYFVQKSLVT